MDAGVLEAWSHKTVLRTDKGKSSRFNEHGRTRERSSSIVSNLLRVYNELLLVLIK